MDHIEPVSEATSNLIYCIQIPILIYWININLLNLHLFLPKVKGSLQLQSIFEYNFWLPNWFTSRKSFSCLQIPHWDIAVSISLSHLLSWLQNSLCLSYKTGFSNAVKDLLS